MFSLQIDGILKLELLDYHHAAELFALVRQNVEHLDPWMPWAEKTTSVQDIEAFIDRGLTQYGDRNGFQLGIMVDSSIVGVIGLHHIDWSVGKTELGYWIAKNHEGKGIVTKTVKRLIQELFARHKLNRIEIKADPKNSRSRAIPKRLGFFEEGILRQVINYKGEHRDQVIYSLLKEEWRTE